MHKTRSQHSASADTHAALQRFFDGVAAGAELEQLVHALHTSLRQQQQQQQARHGHDKGTRANTSLLSSPQFCKAAKAAILFGVESNAVAEEATRLYYSCDDEDDTDGGSCSEGRVRAMGDVVGGAHLPALLSDRVTAELARRVLHEDNKQQQQQQQQRGRSSSCCGSWQRALRLLARVDRTPTTASAVLDVCSRAGLWSLALEQLSFLPPRRWSEVDVGNTIRALYRAAPSLPHVDDSDDKERNAARDEWCMLPRRVLLRAATCGVRLSTPSALNDALGALATQSHRRIARREARCLLDLLLAHTARADSSDGDVAETGCDVATLASSSDDDDGDDDDDSSVATMTTTTSTAAMPRRQQRLLLFAAVRANAVTVYQACRALRGDALQALHYTTTLMQQHRVAVAHDLGTCEALLHLHVATGCWTAALSVVRQRHEWLCTQQQREQKQKQQQKTQRLTVQDDMSHTAYKPALFVQVLRLLCAHAGTETATRLLLPRDGWQVLRRVYTVPTMCAVLNVLLQHTPTAWRAERYRRSIVALATAHRQRLPQHILYEQLHQQQLQLRDDDDSVEHASYAHLAMLHATEGEWQQALTALRPLLQQQQQQEQRRQATSTYTPTAQLHDAVQYALECGGAPWHVAVQLYKDMCAYNTPLSGIAFQSAMRTCMRQGAHAQAQALLQFMVRTGVRR